MYALCRCYYLCKGICVLTQRSSVIYMAKYIYRLVPDTEFYGEYMSIENISSESIEDIKSKTIDDAYLSIIVFMMPMIYCLLQGLQQGNLYFTTFAVSVFFCAFLGIYMFRKKVPYMHRVTVILIAAFSLGTNSLLRWGIASAGPALLLIASYLAALHLHKGLRKYLYLLSIVLFMITGYLVVYSYVDFGNDLSEMNHRPAIWVVLICAYILLLNILIRSVQTLHSYLSNTIAGLTKQNETINRLAYFDPLTELPNRLKFRETVMTHVRSIKSPFLIAYIDIDDFKKINNLLGHKAGDQAIRSIAKRLQLKLPEDTLLARMGGDEFAILYPHAVSDQAIDMLLRAVHDAFEPTLNVNGAVYHICCCMGFIAYPANGHTYEDLLKHCDAALFEAKSKGRNNYVIYNDNVRQSMDERIIMEGYLEGALTNGELTAYYQPKYKTSDGSIVGFEALARWNSPKYGSVSPTEFIPILEETGMIVSYGRNIMWESLSQLKAWHKQGYTDLTMAVNVSAVELSQQDFVNGILDILNRLSIQPKFLEIEVTESILIQDFQTVEAILKQLSDMGIVISLDDFGTGYSSLNYLRKLPITQLKIDRSFVRVIDDPEQHEVLLPSIIEMAHNLGLKVVAEGIETQAQIKYLAGFDCDYLQGFYFCKPEPAQSIELILKENKKTEAVMPLNDHLYYLLSD